MLAAMLVRWNIRDVGAADCARSSLEAQVRKWKVEKGWEKSVLWYPRKMLSSVHSAQSSPPQLDKTALTLAQVVLN